MKESETGQARAKQIDAGEGREREIEKIGGSGCEKQEEKTDWWRSKVIDC